MDFISMIMSVSDDSSDGNNYVESFIQKNKLKPLSSRLIPFIPEDVDDDELIASTCFIEGYTARYGHSHAPFYLGTLSNALQQCQNRMLGLYLHHNHSMFSNIFCSQVLGSEIAKNFLENYFVLWGWDMTFNKNVKKLETVLRPHISSEDMDKVFFIKPDQLPALFVIMKMESRFRIIHTTRGDADPAFFCQNLKEMVNFFIKYQREETRKQRKTRRRDENQELEEGSIAEIEENKVKHLGKRRKIERTGAKRRYK